MQHEGDPGDLPQGGGEGPDLAADTLLADLEQELHAIAGAYMRRERAQHTLQPTALVNEAYLRLADDSGLHWESRPQFLAVAAQMMRRILVEHARARGRKKRGGGWSRVPFEAAAQDLALPRLDLLDLHEALTALAAVHARSSRVVELRFFGGLNLVETAEVMGLSKRTVEGDWYTARAWLARRLGPAS
jgi:RNA polymerase sigma factor (TIGR02999 family)